MEDPVYSFSEVVDRIDLRKYFVEKESKVGRPRYDGVKMLKIILFAFMENGYASVRKMSKLCKTDIRYMWLLDGMKAPSFMKISQFIQEELTERIEDIFREINEVIFKEDEVDLEHTYIDGTKIEANANKYSWVWKNSCITNREKVFGKISDLFGRMNEKALHQLGIEIGTRTEYAIEYLEEMLEKYAAAVGADPESFVHGKGKHKSLYQKQYEELNGYIERLKRYAKHISVCGKKRNSYSKTDHDARFMRIKTDYMGNDQLLSAYNMQTAICSGYVAVMDVQQYASDMDCFVPLMEKYNRMYGHYPKYPVADAGYGSYNNYLYCHEKGIEVSVLVNNAGYGDYKKFVDADLDKLLGMIDLNNKALVALTHYFVKDMKEMGYGHIINVGSVASFMPGPYMAVYYASKAFVMSFSLALREELKKDSIKVSVLCPGPTNSDFWSVADGKDTAMNTSAFTRTPIDAAKTGYALFESGKAFPIDGTLNRLMIAAVRFMPLELAARAVGLVQKTVKGKGD